MAALRIADIVEKSHTLRLYPIFYIAVVDNFCYTICNYLST